MAWPNGDELWCSCACDLIRLLTESHFQLSQLALSLSTWLQGGSNLGGDDEVPDGFPKKGFQDKLPPRRGGTRKQSPGGGEESPEKSEKSAYEQINRVSLQKPLPKKKTSHVRQEVSRLQSGQQQRKLSGQQRGGSTVSHNDRSTTSSKQRGSSVSHNGHSTTGYSSKQNSRKSIKTTNATSRNTRTSGTGMSDSSEDEDEEDSSDEETVDRGVQGAKSKYQNSAAKLAHEVTPEGQKIAKLEAELRKERDMVELKDTQLRKKTKRYEFAINELEEKLEVAQEEIEKLRSRNADLVSALNTVGRNEPQGRRQEMVKQVEKVVVKKVFPSNPFIETKEGLVKITAGIKESFDFEDEEEADGFVTAYCCVVRAKINQLRSYAVKGLKDAAMLGEWVLLEECLPRVTSLTFVSVGITQDGRKSILIGLFLLQQRC